jgi:hypothetical protein
MATLPNKVDPPLQAVPATEPARSYQSETYKGVEIRTRCTVNPRSYLWSGNYSFFTRTAARPGSDRICFELAEKFKTEVAAAAACFEAGRQAVDRELRSRTQIRHGFERL